MAISSSKLVLMGSRMELQSKLRSMSVSGDLRAMTVIMQLIRGKSRCYIFAPIRGYFFQRGIQIANYLIINAMSSQPEYLISTLHNLKS